MDDTRLGGRVPAVLRIRLKYADVDTFIEKFSVNLSRGGLFIASKAPQPVGTTLKFEFQLSQGTPVVRGEGEVIWVKPFDPAAPTKPHGMGVRFVRLDPESKSVIDRALAWKEKSKAAAAEAKAAERPAAPTPPPATPFAKPSPPPPPSVPPPIPTDAAPPRIATEVRMMSAMEAMAKKNTATDEEPEAAPRKPPPPPIARVAAAPVAPPRPLPPPAPRREKRALPDPVDTRVEIETHSGTNGTTTDLDALAADWGLTPERLAKTIEKVRAEGIATDGDALEKLMRPEG
jgi:uncharacterized protein (TIGR02266 family)